MTSMFNNSKPNIVLMSDLTDMMTMPKTLGPYKVARVLRKSGIEVTVIHHLSVFSINEIVHFLQHVVNDQTLFVGVNNFFYDNISEFNTSPDGEIYFSRNRFGGESLGEILPHGPEYNSTIIDVIKNKNANCKLVLGGPNARDVEYNKHFDYIVKGYSEMSAVNLAEHLLDKTVELKKSWRSLHGPVIIDDSRAEEYDFESAEMYYADHDAILPNETLVLEVARGCIFKCAFCAFPMNGKRKLDFIRNAECIKQELLDNYNRFGVTRYIFCDDTVNDSPEKCKMIYDISQSLPFKLEWWGYIRLDLLAAHPQTIDWLFDSGLRSAFFGIETLDQKTAKIIGKGGSREKLIGTVQNIKNRYGPLVNLHGSFVYGLPGESLDSMRSTTDFLFSNDNPLDSWICHPLSIRPNSNQKDGSFLSDLDKNYTKYGYRSLGIKSNGLMLWENEHTNRSDMEKMIEDIDRQKKKMITQKISGIEAFGIAGLGFDLKNLNSNYASIDWHNINRRKLKRANEYKKLLFERCNVPVSTMYSRVDTYTDWIKSNQAFKEK